ncbi:MAG TPA: hypothetical protein VFF78_04030 [Anaerolineaceae bacterium]|nr:hypothetical protein [Anaerolineaceae bacterium]
MQHKFEALKPVIQIVQQLKVPDQAVYLVGGAVRDLLLQRELHDLDFVTGGEVRRLARKVAEALHGAFYMLDEERDTARVVLIQEPFAGLVLDFARFRAEDLEGDLRGRDFTINALAMNLDHFEQVIDPLGGAEDLRQKLLRLCSPTAMADDPVRVLRAVRVAVKYGLHIPAETKRAVRAAVPFLGQVSAERQRDELFHILAGSQVATAIRLLDQFSILAQVLPELVALKGVGQTAPHIHDVWEHTLTMISELEDLVGWLATEPAREDGGANLFHSLAALRLGRYRSRLNALFSQPITAERPRRALFFLGALYHDAAKPEARSVGEDGRVHFYHHDEYGESSIAARAQVLALSQDEIQYLKRLVRQHMRIHFLVKRELALNRRLIYRYFRDLGEVGVDISLHSLADLLATRGKQASVEEWTAELDICRALLEAWYEQPEEAVAPPRLLTGNDVMLEYSLSPGPRIGELLEAVREAQATDEVHTRDEALSLVRRLLEEKPA